MSTNEGYEAIDEFLLTAWAAGRPLRPPTNDVDTGCEVIDRIVSGRGVLGVDDRALRHLFREPTPSEAIALLDDVVAEAQLGVHLVEWSWAEGQAHREAFVRLGRHDDPAATIILDFHVEYTEDDVPATLTGEARAIHRRNPGLVVRIPDIGATALALPLGDLLESLHDQAVEDQRHIDRTIAARKRLLAQSVTTPVDDLVAALDSTTPCNPPYYAPSVDDISTLGDWLSSADFSLLVTAVNDDPEKFLAAAAAVHPDGERSERPWAPRVWRVVMLGPVSHWHRGMIEERIPVSGLNAAELEDAWERAIVGASVLTDHDGHGQTLRGLTTRQRAADIALGAGMLRSIANAPEWDLTLAAIMVFQWDSKRFEQPHPFDILEQAGCGQPLDDDGDTSD